MAAISAATTTAHRGAELLLMAEHTEAALQHVLADTVQLNMCLGSGQIEETDMLVSCYHDPARPGLAQITATATTHGRVELVTYLRLR